MAGEEDDSPALTSLESQVKITQTRKHTGGIFNLPVVFLRGEERRGD